MVGHNRGPAMLSTFSKALLIFGVMFSVMSVVNYLDVFLDLGIKGFLQKILYAYQNFLDFWIGWVDPYLRRILAYLSRIFSLDLRLPENWRDVFVPAWLYFVNDARIAGVFLIVFGGLLAFSLSLASEDPNQSLAIFVAGFVVYETISSLYSFRTSHWDYLFSCST
jgi:hypothetical protein